MKIAQFIEENNYSISIRTINKKYTPRNNIIIGIPKEDNHYEQEIQENFDDEVGDLLFKIDQQAQKKETKV